MAMFDTATGEFNEGSFALDTHAAIAQEPSIFDSLQNVVTKGVPLTGLSIVNSFANTAVDIGNFFGGDNQRLTIEDQVGEGELLDYYKSHQQGIEAAGLIVGSFIPGGVAVKALKLAQAGKMSAGLQRATNIFAGPKQRIIDNALKEIEAGDAALYGALNADKFKAIALGFGDQALQGLVYEAATYATMKASPLLDQDSFGQVVENMFYGALVGAGIGGVIEGIGTRAVINKALVNADTATKQQELATYLGAKPEAFLAGDRVAVLINSIDNIPVNTGGILGRKKAAATRDAAILNSKKILAGMTNDDNEVTNSMFDVLLKMKQENSMSKDDMFNYLARLAKVSRINSPDEVPTGSIFYVNRFAKNSKVDWSQLVTKVPEQGSEFSLGFKLREFATETRIARFDEVIEAPNGTKVPRYATAEEAYAAGNDIFIGKDLKIYVNKNAPNIERIARPGESRALTVKEEIAYRKTGQLPESSKPLYGAPIILNTKTGNITESAVPVVGDFGTPKLFSEGLLFGDKTSLQQLDTIINANTPTIEANARYVWAAMRGTKNGDTIDRTDIAMLEQLHRESVASGKSYEEFISKKKVTFGDGSELPQSRDELLNLIRENKDNLIAELLEKESKLSASDVALRANVPESYLENALKADAPEAYMRNTLEDTTVNHVKLEYDIGSVYQKDGQIMRGLIDTQYRIQLIQNTLQSAAAKFFGSDWQQFVSSKTAADASILGSGAKAFSSSNSAYDTLGQEMERIGRFVTNLSTKKMSEVSQTLSSSVNAIRNDIAAAAELGNFVAVRRRTPEQFMFLPEHIAKKEGFNLAPGESVVVLKNSITTTRDGTVLWNKDYLPEGFGHVPIKSLTDRAAEIIPDKLQNYYKLSPKVTAFERANMQVNNQRTVSRNNWYTAQGVNRSVDLNVLYAPPIDTAKYPHFALVKAREGSGLSDDGVAIVTAETAADLEQKVAALRDEYSVYTKDLLKKHHEVLGDYEYNRNFAQSAVNTALQKKGILNNIFPDTRPESIVRDYVDWHSKQELRLTRDYVEIANAQLFAELRAMGERFTAAETSKTGFTPAALGRSVANPYNSYIKTALAVSDKDEYRLWHEANEKLEAFFSTAFRTAKSAFTGAHKGLISYEEAAKTSERFGLGNPYSAAIDAGKAYYEIANKLPPERYLSKFVATANSVLAATAIRLDFFQSLINAVSTPVLLLAEASSATKAIKQLMTTELPDGSGRAIPATSKLLYNAVSNYFDSSHRTTWLPVYKNLGIVRERSSEYFEMIDQLSLPYGKLSESDAIAKLKKATDIGAKLTGSELSEEFGRFIAAEAGRQVFEAAGYTGRKLTDNIATFVNRVHGNYVASQRPVAFQGPIGQAIGLFQTYQFNLLQQLFRYVENGEGKTISLLAGTQMTLFGMQGLPGFHMINNHIIANSANNPAHKDAYSTVPQFFDKKLGDYLLYGVLSNWLDTGLYSRGDINPRQITILPTNPLDYPAISGGVRFIANLFDTAGKITKGGDISTSLLLGLEHNGLSRPLAGMAQMVQGFVTTGQGSLVSAIVNPKLGDNSAALSELFNAANFARILGARPLDEAITMDAMYRKTLYTAKDTARIRELGQTVKTTMYAGAAPDMETLNDFATKYAAAGGNIQMFGRKVMQWSTDSNASVANKIYRNLSDPINQQMMMIMGGRPLPDYTSAITQEAAPVE